MEATRPQQGPALDADYDVEAVRAQFPALQQEVYDEQPLVYLDNAATTQKPQAVINRLERYYTRENANVHRGVHVLSQQASSAYEAVRERVADFIGAPEPDRGPAHAQIVYTRGTTEAINLVAATWGRSELEAGDEVLLSRMEHHSNIVPWQRICEEMGAELKVIPVTDWGELDVEALKALLSERTELVAVTHVSNTLGTINPVERITEKAHAAGAKVLVDGAQSVPHMEIDVAELGVDFFCFSGHKMYGPTGIGALYGRRELLDAMPPYQGGGDMIDEVSFGGTTYAEVPHKFEAGTPSIADVIALGAAAAWLDDVGRERVHEHERALLRYATERAREIDDIRLVGTAREKASVLSFLLGDVHPYDAGTVLDRLGIAVRTGHHCTQPLMERLEIPGTVRASLACYNTREDIDRLAEGLEKVRTMFG
jgi:cysteine desulfurase/selenocysteine lyase